MRFAFRTPIFNKSLPDATTDYTGFAEAYARRVYAFYDARARWHRRLYRASGILVILAGASLPVLTTENYSGKELLVSCIGAGIAALTALRAFYRWDQGWVLLRQTAYQVQDIYTSWKGSLTADPTNAEAKELLAKISELQQAEAKDYFKDLSYPSAGKG